MRKLLFVAAWCILTSVISGFQPKLFGQQRSTFLTAASSSSTSKQHIQVGELVGSGSYGTVNLLQVGDTTVIGKRPWLEKDLLDQDNPKERATRCRYYWHVEEHIFSKLPPHPQLPPYLGPSSSSSSGEWMLFELIGSKDEAGRTTTPAPTLSDLMKLDADQNNPLAALPNICQALSCDSYTDALDRILVSLMTVLAHVHECKIVHRDVKPSNLLVHNGTLLLIDFGSAADLEPTKGDLLQRRKGLEDGQRVAVSPIYAAPEIFIDIYNHPLGFDIFSSGLLFCQFVFSLLDERMDAGFHQQLEETDWDLNAWLANELASDLRPQGLPQALEYLAARQGLWTLLEDMLAKDPSRRPSAKKALERFQTILKDKGPPDGPFFEMVIESMENCEIITDEVPAVSRPLHFVATFSRKQPLGLILSEQDDEYESSVWKESTKEAEQGEVFVKELVEGGQAEEFGIFEVGDRLSGVGELAFRYGGFEKAVEMVSMVIVQDLCLYSTKRDTNSSFIPLTTCIQNSQLQVQPKKAANVKLHFDRLSVRANDAIPMIPSKDAELQIADSGAWSSKGRRKAQEDAFGKSCRYFL
jgi:serine/threonine protein kinase